MWRRTCFLYEKNNIYYYQFNMYFVIISYRTTVKNILMYVRERSTLYYMVAHSLHDCTTVWQQNSHQLRGARITVSPCYRNLSLICHCTSNFGKLSLLAPVPGSHVSAPGIRSDPPLPSVPLPPSFSLAHNLGCRPPRSCSMMWNNQFNFTLTNSSHTQFNFLI